MPLRRAAAYVNAAVEHTSDSQNVHDSLVNAAHRAVVARLREDQKGAELPTLDAIAENARRFKGMICPVLDARKNKVYACLYRSDGNNVKKISKSLF